MATTKKPVVDKKPTAVEKTIVTTDGKLLKLTKKQQEILAIHRAAAEAGGRAARAGILKPYKKKY